jgi:hypothetical protein
MGIHQGIERFLTLFNFKKGGRIVLFRDILLFIYSRVVCLLNDLKDLYDKIKIK